MAPKRRVRPQNRESWLCKCQVWHPGYLSSCVNCGTKAPKGE